MAHFAFLGRIIGKALYEGVLLDVSFAEFFLAKWIGRQSFLDDLPSLDPELYQGLLFLKNYNGDVEKDLCLNFTVTENGSVSKRNFIRVWRIQAYRSCTEWIKYSRDKCEQDSVYLLMRKLQG